MKSHVYSAKAKAITEIQGWRTYLNSYYGQDNIAYIALYGSQNYGIDTPSSDVDVKAIYVPNSKEAILKQAWLSKTHEGPSFSGHCEIKDIREMNKMFLKQNINFIETLFTSYFYINPKYSHEIKALRKNRTIIVDADRSCAAHSIACQGIHFLNTYNKTKKLKLLANAIFYREFLFKRENYGLPYFLCIDGETESGCLFQNSLGMTAKEIMIALKTETITTKNLDKIESLIPLFLDEFKNWDEKAITTTNLNTEESYLKVKNFLDEQCLAMIFKNN